MRHGNVMRSLELVAVPWIVPLGMHTYPRRRVAALIAVQFEGSKDIEILISLRLPAPLGTDLASF